MVPDDRKYTQEHEWVLQEGDELVVGITDHAAEELGDIVYLDGRLDLNGDLHHASIALHEIVHDHDLTGLGPARREADVLDAAVERSRDAFLDRPPQRRVQLLPALLSFGFQPAL